MTSPHPSSGVIPRKGDILAGKYRVEEKLGRGGMGIVVAAEHLLLGRRVAVKFLLPGAADLPGSTQRFLREAQAAASIPSEHVTRVLDVGTLDGGTPFLVMELLSGADLGAFLKARGPLPVPLGVDLMLQAVDAIVAAHARGIIHRDLKPPNLFVTTRPDGSPFVKVLDFGLSKALLPEDGKPVESLTATSAVMGSPQYMSPEQFRSFKNVDARTDVWALGAILYVMFTGKRPFDGDTFPEICMAIATETPVPVGELRPDLPPELSSAIMHCLVKEKDKRTQSVAELARALAPFASTAPRLPSPSSARLPKTVAMSAAVMPTAAMPSAPPPSPPYTPVAPREPETANAFVQTGKSPASSSPSGMQVALAAGILLLLVGGVIGMAVFLFQSPSSPSSASGRADVTGGAARPASPAAPASSVRSVFTGAIPEAPPPSAPEPRATVIGSIPPPPTTPTTPREEILMGPRPRPR